MLCRLALLLTTAGFVVSTALGFPADGPGKAGAPPYSVDRLTPPPAGPVTLDAEYDSCEGVLVRYPFGFGANIFADMVDAMQDVAVVYIVTSSQTNKANCLNYLAAHGVPDENLEFIIAPTNSVWIRDYGPWFVRQADSTLGIIDMPYAWAPFWTNDDHFPEFLEPFWGMDYYGPNIWHDGGNMMTDGHGTMMMSTYVNDENPGLTHAQICQIYQDYFDQDTCYIFQKISIDLTGHIDLWAKIMNDTTILVAQMQPGDPNYQLIENHAARMATIPTVYGTPFRIVRCPMPPVAGYYKSYLNSTLLNHRAIVPIYNLTMDAAALDSYRVALGPEWDVVGVDCNGIAFAGGAIHCTTIGMPHHEWDYLVNANLSLNPVSPPIVLPPGGGSFNYTVQVQNQEADTIGFDFWTEVRLPNGSLYTPLFKREGLSLEPSGSITRTLEQTVPTGAPAGSYAYRACLGSWLPRVISQVDSFQFTKLGTGDWGLEAGDGWSCTGDFSPGEVQTGAEAVHPSSFTLHPCFPNPFNPTTALSFELRAASRVSLKVYDTAGREVRTLVNGWREAGNHEVTFDGSGLPSGVYLVRLESGAVSQVQKLVLLK
ncbi:MAG: T9SS C-terminal target domain-containing protein [Candidatus Zixiibacteriota bacterium]|nr:MAG: T9SS C-terminal target domain-containing protein [candidate division Zixibacteria bacterium]